MVKIANVFKDGDKVAINANATMPNGDAWPQAGKVGTVDSSPKAGRYLVDFPGFPLANLPQDDLMPAKLAAYGKTAVIPKDDPATPAGTGHTPRSAGPASQAYDFEVLPLLMIAPSLTNPRTYFEPMALQSLADDIAHNGILQPLLVRQLPASRLQETFTDRRKGDPKPTHELVAGERRYRASMLAGVRSVPVLIRHLTDEQVLRMQLIENVQRENLHPLEEAQGYRRILDLDSQADKTMAVRTEELASSVKRSTRYIYQTLQLLQLCDFARQAFLTGKIEHRTIALQIATIGNEAGQIEATRRIAGLDSKGEAINDPLSQRAAAQYVRENHQLVLSKAPFNIKILLAGVQPCGDCPTMSGNALDLFDEGHKGADTCLNRSCYGKKNAAHTEAVAGAAKAKGQRVIGIKEAKKLMPHGEHFSGIGGGFEALDARRYDVIDSKSGNTVRQILGKDMPLAVLIQNPYAEGFIEVLPKADVTRLLKERGLIDKATQRSDDEKARAAKEKFEKAHRWHWAEQLLTNAGNLDEFDLFESLIVPMAVQIYRRLDNECTKRTHKLMGWTFPVFGYDHYAKLHKHFQDMAAGELNKFVVAASVASELHVAQYCNPSTHALECMGEILNVDGKALKAKMQADEKAAAKEKADKAKAKSAPAKKPIAAKPGKERTPNQAFMAPLFLSPALQAVIGEKARPRTEIVSALWSYIKKHGLQDLKNKRLINSDSKLHAIFGKASVSMFEFAGLIGGHVRNSPYPAADPTPTNKTQWRDISPTELKTLQPGPRVRIKSEGHLQQTKKAYAGDVGTLGARLGDTGWLVNLPTSNLKQPSTISFDGSEFQLEVIDASAHAGSKKAGDTWTAAELEAMFYDTQTEKIYRPRAVKDANGKIWTVLGVGFDSDAKPGKPRVYNFSTWHVKHQESCNTLHAGQAFELTDAEKATREAETAKYIARVGEQVEVAKTTPKRRATEEQLGLSLDGKAAPNPQAAWPFSSKPKVQHG